MQLLMLSYMLLPKYANEGGLPDQKHLEEKYTVPNNVVALLFLPVYSAVMMSYQQDFLTSVAPLLLDGPGASARRVLKALDSLQTS